MSLHKPKINPEDDLGFGSQPVMKNQPLVNKDGSPNVKRIGLSPFSTANNYHNLITMSWTKFWLLVLAGYTIVNIIFAFIYMSFGQGSLESSGDNALLGQFWTAFFFSAQTISTVGYGHISPHSMAANSIAALESMLGLLAFALATGLLYGRFSRPSAQIKYSKNMIVAPYLENSQGLMFRLANMRRNMLLDLEIEIIFSYNELVDGKEVRRFFPLEVERRKVSMLTMNWTIVHPFNNNSPLKDMTKEDMEKGEAGFAILVRAFDDTFSQTVHSRTSYQATEIIWGAKFKPVFNRDDDGRIVLDLSKIDDHEPFDLSTIDSTKELAAETKMKKEDLEKFANRK
jgi:inward rectifier potassium channel